MSKTADMGEEMQRVLTFANLARWVIGSAIAGATAALVTFAVADYAVDDRVRAIEAAIQSLSGNVAGLEERLGSDRRATANEEQIALTAELRDIADKLSEATTALVEANESDSLR
jgi:hypothetical protein